MVDRRDNAWRNRAPGPHAHRNTVRQASDGRGQRCVDSKNSQTTWATTSTSSIRQLLGAADAHTAPATFSTAPTHQLLGSANAETTPARAPAAATQRNMRREEWVTVQGPVKEQQPDGMSHRGGGGGNQEPFSFDREGEKWSAWACAEGGMRRGVTDRWQSTLDQR